MINRDQVTVTVNTYSEIPDSVGQVKKTITSTTTIPIYMKLYNKENVSNPKYADAEYIGLTKGTVTESNTITYNSVTYNVLTVVPTHRYNQVLLKKC